MNKLSIILHIYYILKGIDHVLDIPRVILARIDSSQDVVLRADLSWHHIPLQDLFPKCIQLNLLSYAFRKVSSRLVIISPISDPYYNDTCAAKRFMLCFQGGRLAVDSIVFIVSLLQMIAAIWSSIVCCRATCCLPGGVGTVSTSAFAT